ncbi:hypothetical protein EJB05_21560 [Eragrostis curvula]|uniref:Uncharacterized protein n=1 Tax=Eragrostis curvula TaxID=38414 RepID=A0A5J9V3L9_9POAL|nr:hypothetical protein EJB05_21560 [Eragrostis curvula]
MNLHLLIHSVLMHVSAAMIILIYIPLSIPVKLFMWAFVKPFRKEDLRGKVVLITGASSGIGEELAYQYAKKGACLALVARRKQALEDVAVAARERGSPDVLVLPADVTDPDQSRLAVEETVAHFGKLNHLVANAGVWSICRFDEVTNITAFTKMMDVNFWGSVYPTYYALPHLKASKGKLLVSCSQAGTVPAARTSFYNVSKDYIVASITKAIDHDLSLEFILPWLIGLLHHKKATKAAQLRFYETLRAEVGSEVGVTILTPGFVESEMTKGKVIRKGGDLAVDEEARDVQIGVFPVGRVETLCEVALDAIRKGDWYVTWPSLYRPVPLVALLAPEVFDWLSHAMYDAKEGARPLSGCSRQQEPNGFSPRHSATIRTSRRRRVTAMKSHRQMCSILCQKRKTEE